MFNFSHNKFTFALEFLLAFCCFFEQVSCGKVGDVGGGVFVIIVFICFSFILCIFSRAFKN